MTDRPFTPTLSDHLALETEDARVEHQQQQLDADLNTSGVRKLTIALDGGGMMQRAITLTPDKIAAMNAIERRQLLDWMERRRDTLNERISMLSHNIGREPETPECWRMVGAA